MIFRFCVVIEYAWAHAQSLSTCGLKLKMAEEKFIKQARRKYGTNFEDISEFKFLQYLGITAFFLPRNNYALVTAGAAC